jgi:4-amino-4-deoxy-L-arabinose transferase-like glycosyltransferase/Flp pilus assembly protein TadD
LRSRLGFAAVLVLACVLRIAHLVAISDDVFFDHPIIDARDNLSDAAYLTEESWLGPPEPSWKPPLYAYALAVVRAVGLTGSWAPRVFNLLLDLASCVLVFSLGARLFSRRVGGMAALVVAVWGPLVYFTGELVSASMSVFLYLAVLRVTLWAMDGERARRWLAVGLLVGVTALARAEALLLVPALAATTAIRWRREHVRRDAIRAAALVAGALLAVSPATLRNVLHGGDLVAISANGGINFYMGNAPEYGGAVGLRPGPDWERLVREPENAGIERPGARHSAYFVAWTIRRALDEPRATAAHLATKLGLALHGHELPSNRDVYAARAVSPVLAALLFPGPPWAPWGLVAPIGLVGVAIAVRRQPRARPAAWALATILGATVLFFVTARFRAPAVPLVAMFAAFAIDHGVACWRARRRRRVGIAAAAAVTLAIVMNMPWIGADTRAHYAHLMAIEDDHFRGTVLYAELEQDAQAVGYLERAAAAEPRDVTTWWNLARALARSGRHDDSLAALRHGLAGLDGPSPGQRGYERDLLEAMLALVDASPRLADHPLGRGLRCFAAGDLDCAVEALAVADDPALSARAHLARGIARLAAGQDAGAALDLVAAARARPTDADTQLFLAVVRARIGDGDGARAATQAFLELEWPRGAFYRRALRRSVPSALDQEAIALVVRNHPGDRRAARALAGLSRGR